MDKDHLPLLEDQNPVRRSKIFAGTGSAKVVFTEAIKSLSNVSWLEADGSLTNDQVIRPARTFSQFLLNDDDNWGAFMIATLER
ncbi:hypothetical protein [Klebsiella aerogenes]|uniref:Uncharacterized protein n=1 Tax=Klebsiella aerogenes TaxID=548 RepID=A0AAP9R1E3_KLEAE|nr:hypothetical protein [Klebsiella aerogenes]QMR42783.1 hypothetical protein HV331_26065 [Klebsiella aerogenes]